MRDLREYVQDYVTRLSGSNVDDAWHSLVEAGPAALPFVIREFEVAKDPDVKLLLVQVISQYRSAEAVPFLAVLLRERNTEIWNAALDGLVMVGGQSALDALAAAKATAISSQRDWIDEAIVQIAQPPSPD